MLDLTIQWYMITICPLPSTFLIIGSACRTINLETENVLSLTLFTTECYVVRRNFQGHGSGLNYEGFEV